VSSTLTQPRPSLPAGFENTAMLAERLSVRRRTTMKKEESEARQQDGEGCEFENVTQDTLQEKAST